MADGLQGEEFFSFLNKPFNLTSAFIVRRLEENVFVMTVRCGCDDVILVEGK